MLRALISAIVLTPKDEGLEVDVQGDLAGIAIASNAKSTHPDEQGLAQLKVVAGRRPAARTRLRGTCPGRPIIIEPGKARAALMLLPVAALRIEPGVAVELTRMGFARVEQLIAEPRAPLVKRFGKQLFRRLEQALGHIPEPIEPIFAEQVPRVRRGLLEPIATAEAFATVIADLVAELIGQLVTDGTGATCSLSGSTANIR